MVSRLIGLPLLLAATACATANTGLTRASLVPQNGPKAHVYASYSGSITSRIVHASFNTDKDAHVIVGRLGGDGQISILYPETPKQPTLVHGGKTYNVKSFGTSYDAVPQLYSYASRMQRSYGARQDSYDGRGNGFIFIIATQYPMFTEMLDDHGDWADSLEVDDYYSSFDPRVSIHDLAEELTRGMPYTIDYADSWTSSASSSYADYQYDCAAYGYSGLSAYSAWLPAYGWWFGSRLDSFAWYFLRPPMFYTNGYSSVNACGLHYYGGYRYSAAYTNEWNTWGWALGRPPVDPTPQVVPVPSPAPKLPGLTASYRRPGFRGDDAGGSPTRSAMNVSRPRFDNPTSRTTPTRSTWAPPIQNTRTSDYGNDRFRHGSSSGNGSTATGRSAATSESRPSTPAARPSTPAPAQAAPPPKVERAAAGKPRDP